MRDGRIVLVPSAEDLPPVDSWDSLVYTDLLSEVYKQVLLRIKTTFTYFSWWVFEGLQLLP